MVIIFSLKNCRGHNATLKLILPLTYHMVQSIIQKILLPFQ